MSETDNKPTLGRKPLGLKRSVEAGEVKQTFSHGRTNKVVVEVKRRKLIGKPGEAGAETRAPEPVAAAPEPVAAPAPAPRPVAPPPPVRRAAPSNETPQERVARLQREAEEDRLRQAEEARRREEDERQRAAEEAKRRIEETRRAEQEAAAAAAAAASQPVAEAPAEPAPQPAPAETASEQPAAPTSEAAPAAAAESAAPAAAVSAAPVAAEPAPQPEVVPAPRRFTPVQRPEPRRPEPAPAAAAPAAAAASGAAPATAGTSGAASTSSQFKKPAARPGASPVPARPGDRKNAAAGDRRQSGKLTVTRALNEDEGARARSLAALKRAREKERRTHFSGQAQQREKQVRDVVVTEDITIQEIANCMAEKCVDLDNELYNIDI